eukprot:scaffold8382_cov26-Tisochrysis_lutea.AAC.7
MRVLPSKNLTRIGRGMTGAIARAAFARNPIPEWGVRQTDSTRVHSASRRWTTGPRASRSPVAHAPRARRPLYAGVGGLVGVLEGPAGEPVGTGLSICGVGGAGRTGGLGSATLVDSRMNLGGPPSTESTLARATCPEG